MVPKFLKLAFKNNQISKVKSQIMTKNQNLKISCFIDLKFVIWNLEFI